MVKQDSIRNEQPVRLSVQDAGLVREHFRHPIWATGMEGSLLVLRRTLHKSEHLRTAGLVNACVRCGVFDGLEDVECPATGDFERVVRHVEADTDV